MLLPQSTFQHAAAFASTISLAIGIPFHHHRLGEVVPGLDSRSLSLIRMHAQHAANPLDTASNVLSLTRKPVLHGSSLALHAARAASTKKHFRRSSASKDVVEAASLYEGSAYFAPVTIGGQTFDVILDTGSSDTWIIPPEFECYNATTGQELPQSACNFGPASYTNSPTYNPIQDRYTHVQYADGEQVIAIDGLEDMEFANVKITQQEFGIVARAAWSGDGTTSGLMGLAYMGLTSSQDANGDSHPYSPIMQSLFAQNSIPDMFSIALQRDSKGTSPPSYLALGGLPDVPHDPTFYNTSIDAMMIAANDAEFIAYTIDINGYAVSSDYNAQFSSPTNSNQKVTPLLSPNVQSIVDSGSSMCYVPDQVCESLIAAFSPPGQFDQENGIYTVPCTSRVPLFGVSIANKVFFLDPEDIVGQAVDERNCILGVQSNGGSTNVLGDSFLHNVLAVFDLGNAQMRFAVRA